MKKPIVIVAEDMNQLDYYPFSDLKETVVVFVRMEPAELSLMSSFDLVILDCKEDAESGIKTLQQIKRHHPQTPIIFVTAASSEEIVIRAFRAGAREFIKKPVNNSMLQRTIKNILKLKRLPKEKQTLANDNNSAGAFRTDIIGLPDRLNRVVQYIENNYISDLNLDKLAQIACLSKFHFSRLFKFYVGMNPVEFVVYVRIEKAKQFLAKLDFSVTEVTFKAGFNDTSNFIKNFKRLTSTTPHAYKSLLLHNQSQ